MNRRNDDVGERDGWDSDSNSEWLIRCEQAAEHGSRTEICNDNEAMASEHRRCYEWVEALASPIRHALTEPTSPPMIPEYEDLVEIGRGGMGIVYRGLHRETHRVDAIKVLRPDRFGQHSRSRSNASSLLRQEAKLAARVAHESILPVYQVGEVDGCTWFSMQLVEGVSLHDRMKEGPLSPELASDIMERVARAVDAVHRQGILHGDIKPHNILLEGQSRRPWITDFGVAELANDTSSRLGIAGTPAYMAPELIQGIFPGLPSDGKPIERTIATDIYSLGATLWALLAGQSPCEAFGVGPVAMQRIAEGSQPWLPAKVVSIPEPLLRICKKCTALDPKDRYASAAEMADALSDWLNRPRWNRHFPRLRFLLQVMVAPSLLVSGVITWWLRQSNGAEAWVWASLVSPYVPLFLAFGLSRGHAAADVRAKRELWSMWIGHMLGSLSCLISLRLLCHPNADRATAMAYPILAGLSSAVFIAKSGNFWASYRWIGLAWAILAILFSLAPESNAIGFGVAAAITCIWIARGDRAFREHSSATTT
ncbi:MAG: serine/threonine protein kinase [Pirellula sp.]|jgi:serine/threonine-protein kinase|nr:serine/threonine protein kinase [Pirellula sp.]